MTVLTYRDHTITGERQAWSLEYAHGKLVELTSKQSDGKGTVIEWEPDLAILGPLETRHGVIRQELWEAAHLFSGLRLKLGHEVFQSDTGLLDLAWVRRKPVPIRIEEPTPLHFSTKIDEVYVEVAAVSNKREETEFIGWVNGSRCSTGSHIDGLREGLGLATTNYGVAMVHIMMFDPAYAGPVKDELNIPKVAEVVERLVRQNLH